MEKNRYQWVMTSQIRAQAAFGLLVGICLAISTWVCEPYCSMEAKVRIYYVTMMGLVMWCCMTATGVCAKRLYFRHKLGIEKATANSYEGSVYKWVDLLVVTLGIGVLGIALGSLMCIAAVRLSVWAGAVG